jgi:molybdopterin synthase catalytic subunit
MRVTVRLFAVLRERAGFAELRLDLPEGARVSAAVEQTGARLPLIRDLLPRTAFAVNRAYVKPDAKLTDGDEVALIPPVSGG